MKTTPRRARRSCQRGSVAVETAIVFTFLVLFATLPSIYWAFYFYKYSAAQKAVHHAALYLATAPRAEMGVTGSNGEPIALNVARNIIASEMEGMSPPQPDFGCHYLLPGGLVAPKTCTIANFQLNTQVLTQVNVSITMSYVDPLTGGHSGLWISPNALVPYMGK